MDIWQKATCFRSLKKLQICPISLREKFRLFGFPPTWHSLDGGGPVVAARPSSSSSRLHHHNGVLLALRGGGGGADAADVVVVVRLRGVAAVAAEAGRRKIHMVKSHKNIWLEKVGLTHV